MQHICPICNKTLSRSFCLKRHILAVHEKQRSFCCNLCPTKLSSSLNLKQHKLIKHGNEFYDIIKNAKNVNKRFKYCDNQVTFRIKSPPKDIDSRDWLDIVFDNILKYFKNIYAPNDNDLVGLTISNPMFPDKDAYVSMRKHKALNVKTIIDNISKISQSNTDFSLAGVLNVCYKQIKMS